MRWIKTFLTGVHNLFSANRVAAELDEELDSFIEAALEDKMRSGYDRAEALRQIHLDMGSHESIKERVRDVRWETLADGLLRDIRSAFRSLWKNPLFAAVAVISLSLGIGANTAIFTLIDRLLLVSLPVHDPAALVAFGKQVGGGEIDGIPPGPLDLFPYDFFQQLESPANLLKDVCAYSSFTPQVSLRISDSSSQPARQGLTHLVSGNFFQVLGATPILGRALSVKDEFLRRPVVVASYRFWQDALLGDPDVIGRVIRINNSSFAIIGVMPSRFTGVSPADDDPDFWAPLTMQREITLQPSLLAPRGLFWLHLMGRAQSGVTPAQVQAWITPRLQHYMVAREGPILSNTRLKEIQRIFVNVLPGDHGISVLRARYTEPLSVLMGLVVLVLLIACANLANYLLARAASRERELSTRLALGSGRARVVQQLLCEAMVLALTGGAAGLGISYAATAALIRFIGAGSTHLALSPAPDTRVLFFTLLVSLLTGVAFGLAPIVRVRNLDLAPIVQSNVRSAVTAAGPGTRWFARCLVVSQVALSLLLLVTAGLFVRTLHNLENEDFGFSRKRVVIASFNAKLAGYRPEQLNSLYARMTNAVTALPGVESASVSGVPPIHEGNWISPIYFKARESVQGDTSTLLDRVGPGYFSTVGIPLIRGRAIGPEDNAASLKAAVVNQAAADYFFPHDDAIGRVFTVADPSVKGEFQIIGIVRNSTYGSPRDKQQRMTYLPVAQLSGDDAYAYVLELKGRPDPSGIRRALAKVDPNLPVTDIKSMAEQTDLQLANEILISRLSTVFALLALALACIGIYGVVSYDVLRRSGEIGIRLALGADRASILGMVLRESLSMLAVAIALGLPATLAAGRLFQSQLFGLKVWDPETLFTCVLAIGALMLVSAYVPARRAAIVDPAVTLRHE